MNIRRILLTGFGSGYLPVMPGTWGSVVGLLVFIPLIKISLPAAVILWLIFLFFPAGEVDTMEKELGKDPSIIVMDEILGVSIPLFFLEPGWVTVPLIFFLFRLFDIYKPFGINKLQKFPGAAGVILDDLAAGVISGLLSYLIIYLGVL
jgi:phosphatidylglycerophosphatase A